MNDADHQHGRADMEPHPLAESYPLIEGDEYEQFKADIKAVGQRVAIVLFEGKILDGRHRARACRELGIEPRFENFTGTLEEAAAFVESHNLHRRHLTREQKREAVASRLKADPTRSDRSIAADTKVDHKTVAVARQELELRGEIPHVEKRTDTAGRRQVAKRSQSQAVTRIEPTAPPPRAITLPPTRLMNAEFRKDRANRKIKAVTSKLRAMMADLKKAIAERKSDEVTLRPIFDELSNAATNISRMRLGMICEACNESGCESCGQIGWKPKPKT